MWGMGRNIDIRTLVQQYSSIPLQRFRILQSLDHLDFSEIRLGIVFLFATWSGPCLLGFQRFTRTLKSFTESIEVVVVDSDCVSESSAEKLFGSSGFKIGGWGEAVWIRDGQIIACQLTSSASEALIAEHTKVMLSESRIFE